MDILYKSTQAILKRALDTYGANNQIMVAVEELCELASVLTKFPRYETTGSATLDLRERVVEECADVVNVLQHIQNVFGISDLELVEEAAIKGDRLNGWINESTSMQHTVESRSIPNKPCPLCMYNGADPFSMPCIICHTQPNYKGFTPRKDR